MDRSPAKAALLVGSTTFFFLLVVTHARQQKLHPASNTSCTPRERDALLSFKRGIRNDTSGLLSSWRGDQDCCSWTGVTCSRKTGRVVKLDVSSFFTDTPLLGQISPSLLSLDHLQYLDLSSNLLAGPNGSVPEFLGSMKSLVHLDLSYVPFSGSVPPLLGNLTKLEYLDLSFTSFSGRVPPLLGNLSSLRFLDIGWMRNAYSTDVSWLSRLNLLEYLDMSNISLSEIIDLPVVVNKIPTLKHILLFNCSLPSADQSITHLNLTQLEEIDLSMNYFGHPIASCWFWNVTSIKSLILDETYLHGPFPDALGGMVSLQHLDFSSNGNSATLTVDLKKLRELESIDLDKSLSSGNITDLVDKLQCSRKLYSLSSTSNNMTGLLPSMAHFASLNYIDLTNNSISGVMPRELWNMTRLEYIHISSNRLSGQMPLLPRSLKIFHAQSNFLSGHLPLEFGAPNLESLIISSNYITGQVPPSICESETIRLLDLSNNLFWGELPHCSRTRNLRFLLLSNNSFSGKFPRWLQGYTSLVFLDLSWNKFYGPLPRWIGNLATLSFLQLSHNMFSGDIPVNITELREMQYLNLAANNISGFIPPYLSRFTEMILKGAVDGHNPARTFDESLDTFPLEMKHAILNYGSHGILNMVGIDFSLNDLTGDIPEEISCLDRLSNLNLSWNRLSGNIPEKIGSMKSIESLDLSRNNLFGEIPSSLSDFTYISYLDLSYNNLTGTIPGGRQLDTLYIENPSMYNGNAGLCGPPLQKNCSSNNSNADEHGSHRGQGKNSDSVFFYYGLGMGFVFGCWVVFCALLFSKFWRIRCFRLADKASDEAYVYLLVTWARITRRSSRTN